MPKFYKRDCNYCGNYYIGVGKFFCSHQCDGKSKIGIPRSKIICEKMRKAKLGKNNPLWKGEYASLKAKHNRIRRRKGYPKFCVDCGVTYKEQKLEWTNVDHKYSRKLNDYQGRCRSCHLKYDIKMGFRSKFWLFRKCYLNK